MPAYHPRYAMRAAAYTQDARRLGGGERASFIIDLGMLRQRGAQRARVAVKRRDIATAAAGAEVAACGSHSVRRACRVAR